MSLLDRVLRAGACVAIFFASSAVAQACAPIDYITLPLPAKADDPAQTALRLAYPDIVFSQDGTQVTIDGVTLEMGEITGRAPADVLRQPTMAEQFAYAYPLDYDLTARETPWHDPGRIRHQGFLELLYAGTEVEIAASLRLVRFDGLADAGVRVTTLRGVDCQLDAAVSAIRETGGAFGPVFENPAGGFNWRVIAGTDRLSAHSFGIAVDLNIEYGGYWRWSGAPEGAVGHYEPRMPPEIVAAFERYGFIWGGKWHHYDGFHFEYRPELILHARLLAANR